MNSNTIQPRHDTNASSAFLQALGGGGATLTALLLATLSMSVPSVTLAQDCATTALTNHADCHTTQDELDDAVGSDTDHTTQVELDTHNTDVNAHGGAKAAADAAQADADTALGRADDAQSTADDAVTAAGTAQTRADGAHTAAGTAQTRADAAHALAGDADGAADAAQSTADGAVAAAGTAHGRADDAYALAGDAEDDAATAQGDADAAQMTADDAVIDAEAAQMTADDAHTLATTNRAGIAMAFAFAHLPTVQGGGWGIAAGTFESETAFAIGAHFELDNNVHLKVGGSASSDGEDSGFGIGFSKGW